MCVWHKNLMLVNNLDAYIQVALVKIRCVENQLGPVQTSRLCQAELNSKKARLQHHRNKTLIRQTSCQSPAKYKIY